ncbi:hypothetical protein [Agathobaculum desmolans]|uniref:hypothetical protein n=1 Tax=Agathobaculum desmolans TaxID=39484 RepID=UPI002943D0E2|nr:hypothetical protein [Agathobaculum desmolans]
MSFEPQKLSTFSKKIIDLPDQPNMQPHELKEYFDSSPEELRQSHNGLCDALTAKTAASALGFSRTAGVPADTVQTAVENVQQQLDAAVMGNIPSGSVTGDKLAQDVRDRLTAIESAAAAEASTRAGADSNLQNQINTHTAQIASKAEVICGYYDGDGTASRTIDLGKTPKAVLVVTNSGEMYTTSGATLMGGLAVSSSPVIHSNYSSPYGVEIVSNGFQVCVGGTYDRVGTNFSGRRYNYVAVI